MSFRIRRYVFWVSRDARDAEPRGGADARKCEIVRQEGEVERPVGTRGAREGEGEGGEVGPRAREGEGEAPREGEAREQRLGVRGGVEHGGGVEREERRGGSRRGGVAEDQRAESLERHGGGDVREVGDEEAARGEGASRSRAEREKAHQRGEEGKKACACSCSYPSDATRAKYTESHVTTPSRRRHANDAGTLRPSGSSAPEVS